MARGNTGTIKPGEIRNPKGRGEGPLPRTVFKNAIKDLLTENHHAEVLQRLWEATSDKNPNIRMEALKLWFHYFPPNKIILPPKKILKTQQDVGEYSSECLDFIFKEHPYAISQLKEVMDVLERHSGHIRAAQIEKTIMDDLAMSC